MKKGIEWILDTVKDIPVIYILGNHEYYKGSYPKTLRKIVEHSQDTNVHVPENRSVVIGDVTFHGATLWTDFDIAWCFSHQWKYMPGEDY